MGRRSIKHHHSTTKSHTLPSSPTHSFSSSSSSDFEFTISLSPHKSSSALCPADELFYKGQLLPLHLSPRLSMVRTLLLSSSSTSSSSDTTTTASRDSTASHSSDSSSTDLLHHLDCDSSRPSSVTDDEFKRLTNTATATATNIQSLNFHPRKSSKYFSLSKFSSVFRKEHKNSTPAISGGTAVKRVSSSAKEVIRKYLKKVKPLYEKLSQKQQQQQQQKMSPPLPPTPPPSSSSSSRISKSANTTLCMAKDKDQEFINHPKENTLRNISHSFSGNLRYPRRRSCISSCPSSMGSSPSHGKTGFGHGFGFTQMGRAAGSSMYYSDTSSMEELQSAIQGAIAHCKNSMMQNKTLVSNEI